MHYEGQPNGSFDMRTLSIIETAPRSWHVKPYEDTDGLRAFPELDRAHIRRLPRDGVFADLTSRHEHNHFVRHCSSEWGAILTLLLITHHEQRKAVFASRGTEAQFLQALQLTEQVIDCLTSPSAELTQAEAVEVMNEFYSRTFGITPFATEYPGLPACPSGILAYSSLLECSAVLSEHSYFDIQSTDRGTEEDELLRAMHRDPVTYLMLPTTLIERLGSVDVASIATSIALETRVPLVTSEPNEMISWDNFHPGWRLYKLVESYPPSAAETLIQLRTESPIGWKIYGQSHDYLLARYDLFRTIARGYSMPLWEDDNPLMSFEHWMHRARPAFGSFLADRYRPHLWQGVFNHLIGSFNAFQEVRKANFLAFAGVHELVFPDGEPNSQLRGLDLSGPHPFRAANALFSLFACEFDSTYLRAKPIDVWCGITRFLEAELLDCAIGGFGKAESLDRVKAIGRFPDDGLQQMLDRWIASAADVFF